MRRWKKITLVLLGTIILSQLPFAYRRYKLGQLHAIIVKLNAERRPPQSLRYKDYKGVIHVHSMLGGHSTGSFMEIISAARSNGLDFVVMTEHSSSFYDTSAMTLNGLHGGVLFLNGNEVSTSNGDRLLLIPGDETAPATGLHQTQEVIAQAKAKGHLVFVAYPQEFKSPEASGYDGIEVFNLFTSSRRANYFLLFMDGVWSYWSYPELLFTRYYERPAKSLANWDEVIQKKNGKLVIIAGNDAHANVGISLGDETGRRFFNLKLDPYERSFQVVRNHVLLEEGSSLTAENLEKALAAGHSYLSFDLFGEASGFGFSAAGQGETRIMGDQVELGDGGLQLNVTTPIPSRIKLFKDGLFMREEQITSEVQFPVNQQGVYRVEAYLDQLGEPLSAQPWIISNPIYVK